MSCAAISFARGETVELAFVARIDGEAFDVSAHRIYFAAKYQLADTAMALSKRTVNAGGAAGEIVLQPQTGGTLGGFVVHVEASETAALTESSYYADLWIEYPTGDRYRLASFRINADRPTRQVFTL